MSGKWNEWASQFGLLGLLIVAAFQSAWSADADSEQVQKAIEQVRAVQREGQGNVAAQQAVQTLHAADATALVPILNGFSDANPLAVNWLRASFEMVADSTLKSGQKLPAKQLEAFLFNREQDPRARRLAYEWLVKVDPTAPDRVIPQMIDDPNPDFRRDAASRLQKQADEIVASAKGKDLPAAEADQAKSLYRQALSAASDRDQVMDLAKSLEKLGTAVDLVDTFGFVTDWMVVGPFNNRDGVGFAEVYPPEKKLDLSAKYDGQLGEVAWQPILARGNQGTVDIAESLFNHKGSCMYLTTDFFSGRNQPAEFRFITANAWKLWLNGELIFAREEYHRGSRWDQYKFAVQLRKGKNTILVKLCQNEQTDPWAQKYQLQFRVVEPSGRVLHSLKQELSSR